LAECDQHLIEAIEATQPQGQMTVEVKRNPTQASRIAQLSLRYTTVTLQPPQHRPKTENLAPLTLQVILVTEEHSSEDVEPIRWLLLTTLDLKNLEDVKQCVQWYSYRWLIERYHYVLKSGCQLEQLQLKSAQRIEMALATYSIVAWRLLWLTYLARCSPTLSCEEVLEPYQWHALYTHVHRQKPPDAIQPTLAQVVQWIAQLGGFLNRKGDGVPGVKVLWRGLTRLDDIAQTWLLCQSLANT
ncbi:MAG: IS4 family transposase, partial [Chroococcales cyanobacterium]